MDNMKKILKSVFLFLSLGLLASCGENTGGEVISSQFSMKATVTNVGDRIEINVYEAEYAEGIYWLVTDKNTVVEGQKGERLSLSDIKAGDNIEVGYNGQVMMSYPPQVYAIKLKILE